MPRLFSGLVRDAATIISMLTENDAIFCSKIVLSSLFPVLLSCLMVTASQSKSELIATLFDNVKTEDIGLDAMEEQISLSLHIPILKILYNMMNVSLTLSENGDSVGASLLVSSWRSVKVVPMLLDYLKKQADKVIIPKSNAKSGIFYQSFSKLKATRMVCSASIRVINKFILVSAKICSSSNTSSYTEWLLKTIEEIRENGIC
jgi:hypothetical protein